MKLERDTMVDTEDLTLDGKPACIRGRLLPFALVYKRDDHSPGIEFSWAAVERVISTTKNFQS